MKRRGIPVFEPFRRSPILFLPCAAFGRHHCYLVCCCCSPRCDLAASMGRCARVGALGLCMLAGAAMGHMNSEVNLVRNRRLQEEDSSGSGSGEEESVNAKWQCEPNEVITRPAGAAEKHKMNARGFCVFRRMGWSWYPPIAPRGVGALAAGKDSEKSATSSAGSKGRSNICVRVMSPETKEVHVYYISLLEGQRDLCGSAHVSYPRYVCMAPRR